jgi:hypothetical protein
LQSPKGPKSEPIKNVSRHFQAISWPKNSYWLEFSRFSNILVAFRIIKFNFEANKWISMNSFSNCAELA